MCAVEHEKFNKSRRLLVCMAVFFFSPSSHRSEKKNCFFLYAYTSYVYMEYTPRAISVSCALFLRVFSLALFAVSFLCYTYIHMCINKYLYTQTHRVYRLRRMTASEQWAVHGYCGFRLTWKTFAIEESLTIAFYSHQTRWYFSFLYRRWIVLLSSLPIGIDNANRNILPRLGLFFVSISSLWMLFPSYKSHLREVDM